MAGAVATISKIAYSSNYEDNDNTDATGSAGAVGLVYAAIAFEITDISFSYSRKFCITLTLSIEAFRYNKIITTKKYKFAFMILFRQKIHYFSCCEDFFTDFFFT